MLASLGRQLHIAVLCLWWGASAAAQQVHGHVAGMVVDSRTEAPVPAADVSLGGVSRTTDATGRFAFEEVAVGPQVIVVSRVGYAVETFTVVVESTGIDVRIAITEGLAAHAESVTVTAGPFSVRELGVAGQQSLNSGELRQLGGMTLDDPLRAVQALSGATASDDLAGELAVRGNGFRDLEYTLDDVPARYLIHTVALYQDGGSVGMVNSDVLDRVTLLRGARPQRVEQRLGAAVAFATSEGSRSRSRFNVTASGTSASLTADGPLANGRGSWLVSTRRSYLDFFLRRILNDSSVAFGFSDIVSKASVDPSDAHHLEALLVAGHSRFDAGPDATRPDELGSASHTGWLLSGAWRHAATPTVTLSHRLYVTGESYDNRSGIGVRAASGDHRNVGYRLDVRVASTPTALLEIGGSVERLSGGARHADRVPGWQILGGEDMASAATKVGVYAHARWTHKRWTVSPGSRADRFGLVDRTVVSPWVSAEFAVTPALTVVGGAGVHHQWPEFEAVAGRRGSHALRPARARQLDAGLEGTLTPSAHWRLTAYRRDERHVVDLPDRYVRRLGAAVVEPSTSSIYANRLRGTSQGIEGLLGWKGLAFSGWMTYAFGHTMIQDTTSGARFDGDFDQRHTVSVLARRIVSERTSVNLRWRLGSNTPLVGYFEVDQQGRHWIGETRNAARVPVYTRLDVRVDRTFQWGTRRLTLFGEIANTLNHRNVRQSPSFIDPDSGRVYELFRRTFPILPSLGFTLEL